VFNAFSKWLWSSLVVIVLVLASGCRSTGAHVRWYPGPPLSTNQVALLKVQRDIWTVILTVDKIDDQPLATSLFMGNNTKEIELPPGHHDLEVSYRDSNNYKSTADTKIGFLSEPGMVYELRGAPRERSLGKTLTQAFTLQVNWYWTCWIVDTRTNEVVAGIPRETPLHWYEK
jgi:hypothetical protein